MYKYESPKTNKVKSVMNQNSKKRHHDGKYNKDSDSNANTENINNIGNVSEFCLSPEIKSIPHCFESTTDKSKSINYSNSGERKLNNKVVEVSLFEVEDSHKSINRSDNENKLNLAIKSVIFS